MTIRKLLCAAAVLAVVAPAAFSATGDIALPTWPQSFKLHPGQVSVFGFPITRAGNAVVDLNWTGNDLAVQLVDSSAGSTPTVTGAVKTLAASDKHSAPKAHLTLALTPTQVAHSNIWYISVTCLGTGHMPVDPRTPPQPEALGTITITYPSVDQALLQPKLKALVLTRQTALSAVHPAGPKPITFQARLAAHNKLLNDRIAALTKLLTTRMKANVASADTARVALTRVTLRHLPSTGPSLHNVTFGPGFKGGLGTKLTGGAGKWPLGGNTSTPVSGQPTIASVTPASGHPGDEMTIRISGGATDPTKNQAIFTIGPMIFYAVPVLSATPAGASMDLKVAVPYDAAANLNYAGSVVVKDDQNRASAAANFQFLALPKPTLTDVQDANSTNGVGDTLFVDGANFAPGSQVYFKFSPGSTTPVAANLAPGATVSTTFVSAVIPTYSAPNQPLAATVFVRYHYKAAHLEGDMQSDDYSPVMLDVTVPQIASIGCTDADVSAAVQSIADANSASSGGGAANGSAGGGSGSNSNGNGAGGDGSAQQIATVSTPGLPNVPILISGLAFGAQRGMVHFRFGGANFASTPLAWSPTQILVKLPDYSGLPATVTGTIWVTLPFGGQTASYPFSFAPQNDPIAMDLSQDLPAGFFQFCKSDGNDSWYFTNDGGLCATHHNSFWHWNYADDVLYNYNYIPNVAPAYTFHLKPGWTVDSIGWDGQSDMMPPMRNCNYHAEHINTDDPSVMCYYWLVSGIPVDYTVTYTIHIYVKGPLGCSYK